MARQSKKGSYPLPCTEDISAGYAKLSHKSMASSRSIVVLAGILVAIADLVALLLLTKQDFDFIYLLFPILLLAADVVFAVLSFFTNFRFRYSLAVTVSYLVLSVAFVVLLLVQGAALSARYITYAGLCFILAPHLVLWLTAAWSTRLARIRFYQKRKGKTILAIAILAIACVVYSGYNLQFGFFGQGIPFSSAEKTVVYELVEGSAEGGHYVAQSVLNGKGDSVTIKEMFNGKEVKSIDCNLFAAAGLKKVNIEGTKAKNLLNLSAIANINNVAEIKVAPEAVDEYRNTVFSYARASLSQNACALLNAFVPEVLASEVFVNFSYDSERISSVIQDKPIPTFFAQKGTVFTSAKLGVYESWYGARNSLENSYNYYQKYRMLDLLDAGGSSIVGKPINTSISSVAVDCERVYKVERKKGEYAYSGAWQEFTYVAATSVDNVLAAERVGCTVSWNATMNGKTKKITSDAGFSEFLTENETQYGNVSITPTWKVNTPEISSLETNGTRNMFVYGDRVQILSTAKKHALSLKFAINDKNGEPSAWQEEGNFQFFSLTPLDSGDFTVVVRATDVYDERLYSEISQKIRITVQKKELDFAWTLPGIAEYSGLDKTASAVCLTTLIGTDTLSGSLVVVAANAARSAFGESARSEAGTGLSQNVKNAGGYTFTVVLSGDTKDKYSVKQGEELRKYTVTPKTVQVTWQTEEYTYDGTEQRPTASATGVEADGNLTLTVDGGKTNAGIDYTATASLVNNNYILENSTKPFAIMPCQITLNWSAEAITYSGKAQRPDIKSINGAVEGEVDTILGSLSCSEWSTHIFVDSYQVTAILPAVSNYVITSNKSKDYTIGQASLNISGNANKKIYDGTPISNTATWEGLVGEDQPEEVYSVTFGGPGAAMVNASDGEKAVTLSGSGGLVKSGNYAISFKNGTAEITPREITITADSKGKTYDGAVYTAFSYTVPENGTAGGLATTDTIEEVGTVTFEGTAVGAINASDDAYAIALNLTEGAKHGNYKVTLVSGKLTINRANLTITADSKGKTYDGATYTAFSYTVPEKGTAGGLAIGDNLSEIGTILFQGDAISAKNASSYIIDIVFSNTGSKRQNYTVSFVHGELTIGKKALTIKASEDSKVYDGFKLPHQGIFTGLAEGDTSEDIGTLAFSDVAAVDVCTNVAVTLSISAQGVKYGNYAISFENGSVTITQKALIITADSKEKTYDGAVYTAFSYTVPENGTAGGLATTDTIEEVGTVTFEGTAVGAINASDDAYAIALNLTEGAKYGNYDIKYVSGTLTVNKREVTVSKIDSPAITKTYDETTNTDFAFVYGTHYTLSGAVGTEIVGVMVNGIYNSADVLSANIVSATFLVLVGGEGFLAANYDYTSGTVLSYAADITKMNVAVVWGNTTLTYSGAPQAPTASATGVKGETIAITVNGAETNAQVSPYTATALTENGNYSLTNASTLFTIGKKDVAVVWGNTTLTYSGAPQAPTASATGVKGETIAITVNGAETNAQVSPYTATALTENGNYSLTNASTLFTIGKKQVPAVWSAVPGDGWVVDGAPHAPALVTEGQEYGADITNISYRYFNEGGEEIEPGQTAEAGTYSVTVTYTSINYALTGAEVRYKVIAVA